MNKIEGKGCERPYIDIPGIGVRSGVYTQATITLLCAFYCLYLSTQPRGRLHGWAKQALTNVFIPVLGVSLHVYIMVHTIMYGLSSYDAAVHMSLSWLTAITSLLLALLNWLMEALDLGGEPGVFFGRMLPGALMQFSMTAMMGNVASVSTGFATYFCPQYGADPPYVPPTQFSPLIMKTFMFTFDIVVDHVFAALLPQVGIVAIFTALSNYMEHRGVIMPPEWMYKGIQADTLNTVTRGSLKVVGTAQVGLLTLCAWATKNVARVGWTMAICVLICGTSMGGFMYWTETVVAGMDRAAMTRPEDAWRQRIAFSVLVLPAVMVIPNLWLIPYLRSTVRNTNHDRKEE